MKTDEDKKTYHKNNRLLNKEKMSERKKINDKKYKDTHKEKVKEANRLYFSIHKEEIRRKRKSRIKPVDIEIIKRDISPIISAIWEIKQMLNRGCEE